MWKIYKSLDSKEFHTKLRWFVYDGITDKNLGKSVLSKGREKTFFSIKSKSRKICEYVHTYFDQCNFNLEFDQSFLALLIKRNQKLIIKLSNSVKHVEKNQGKYL